MTFDIMRQNRGKWKSRQSPPRHLAWAANALPLSHDSRTTTSPHNPLHVLHRWYWMPQSHIWQPLSMYCQNSVRGWLENSLRQERTHAEWFSWILMLWGEIDSHLFPVWGKMPWAFRVRKPLSMGFFLTERIFRSTHNGVLTVHTERLPDVWLRHSVPSVQYM